MPKDGRVCAFYELNPGQKFIFRDRNREWGSFIVAVRSVKYPQGTIKEIFVVNLLDGSVVENVEPHEVVAKLKNC